MLKRYLKNLSMITEDEITKINSGRICVIGCGSLGEYVLESLARLGFENLTAVDRDIFNETDLNRQIYANRSTIGLPKATIVQENIKKINDRCKINTMTIPYDEKRGKIIIKNHDIIVNTVSDLSTKLLLEKHCSELNIPIVHGESHGWTGYIGVISPNTGLFPKIHEATKETTEINSPSFTSAVIANIMVSEILKFFISMDETLLNKLLKINLSTYDKEIIELN